MFPRILDLGAPWILSTYGVLVAVGFVAGMRVAVLAARRDPEPPLPGSAVVDVSVYGILAGLAGAKLMMFAVDWRTYAAEPRLLLDAFRYAGVFYGGLAAGAALVLVYCRVRRIPILQMLDALAPGAAFAHALGRLGCFAAGCCYGRRCEIPGLGVTFRDPGAAEQTGVPLGVPLHPVQLYEAAGNLVLFGFRFFFVGRRPRRRGEVTAIYLSLYALMRYALEEFRGDARGSLLGGILSTSQALALAALCAGIVLWLRVRRRGVPLGAAAEEA